MKWLHYLVVIVCLVGAPVRAAEPVIRNVNLRGLQVGGTTTLAIDGDHFGKSPRLLLPFAAQQLLKKESTDKQAHFNVTLGADVVPGYCHLRVVTDDGVSAPVVIAVDGLPQRALMPMVESLPIALHGALTGSTTAETKFAGKAGQKVLVEVEAQRLGSKLRPIVHLMSAKRLQLAWAWTTPSLHGDARLEATLPADGTYTVTLHDTEYAGPAPGFYRLRIGQWSAADLVFPPVVAKGQGQTVELLGPAPPVKLALPAPMIAGVMPLPWPKDGLWSGPRPFVHVSSHPELLGQTAPGKLQELPGGAVGVSGRITTPFGEDRYRLPVTAGTRVRLEVFADRYGSPLDAALVVRNDKGDQVARVEDAPGTLDPVLDYAVPAGIKEIVVGVVDAQGRGGPRAIYRLTVEPQGTTAADYRLFTPTQGLSLPINGRWVVPVLIERRGYAGPVELSAANLPAGVKLDGATIPPEADGALVTVQRGDAPGAPAVTHWLGRAGSVERPVAIKGSPMATLQPWLADEIALAPTTAKAGEYRIDWGKLSADAGPVPAKKLLLPIKVARPAKDSVVKLTLLTSQLRPVVNGQLDPNQALRLEKPVEFGPKMSEGELTVIVPPQPLCPVYDVTVQAEFLTPDKKTVLAIAFAPVRRMLVRVPLVVKLDGPPRIVTTANPKAATTVKIAGQVERKEGLTSDVTLTLTGLPPGFSAAPVVLKGGTTAFTLNVAMPANQATGEFKGLKLTATAPADPKTPNVVVRSREVELTLAVTAGK